MSDKKEVGHFDILKTMAHENQDIRLAPLSNVTSLNYYAKRGTEITIGFPGNICCEFEQGKFGGGLLLYDQKQYMAIKKRLEEA